MGDFPIRQDPDPGIVGGGQARFFGHLFIH